MKSKNILFSLILICISCGNNISLEIPNNNQPIRDLVDSGKTNSTNNSYQSPSSISNTNSSGAVGGTMSGAVGTPSIGPATGTATGNYSGNPTPSGY